MTTKSKDSLIETTSIAKVSEAVRSIYTELNKKSDSKEEKDEMDEFEPWPCFKKRIENNQKKLKLNKNENDLSYSQKIVKKAFQNEQVLHTPAGLRLLLDVKTTESLRGYCEVFNPDFSDLDMIDSLEKISPISQYCLLMAIGIYAQNTLEKMSKAIDVPYSEKRVSAEAFKRFKNKESFWEGVLFSKRIWHVAASSAPKKRGRRPKAMTAKHYAGDFILEESNENIDINNLLNEIENSLANEK